MSPEDMGGVPAVMPSNDWWKAAVDLGGRVLDTYENIQLAKTRSGVAAPSGVISSNARNYPPGRSGANPQAAGIAGGSPMPFSWEQLSFGGGGALVLLAVLAAVVMLARR
jgi:hypothetical protein